MAAAEQANDVAGPSPGASGGKEAHGLMLPLARVKKMMKECADVKTVSADANFVLTRAAELFLQELAMRAHTEMLKDEQRKVRALDYKDLANVVQSWDALDFLHEVVPQKVSAAAVLAKLQQEEQQQDKEQQDKEQQDQEQQEEEQE